MNVLQESNDFTIECELNDDECRSIAETLVGVFSQYSLDGNETRDPLSLDVGGIEFIVRYKPTTN